ncbi:MAG TPA: carbohydrate ABC transporter permease [Spirochaetia bacterium]|nr:carbohydrate ABC transporter permease [Spirochaetia bacterium]
MREGARPNAVRGGGVLLAILVLVVLVPMVWGFGLAFRSNEEIARIGGLSLHTFVPVQATLDNFSRFFAAVSIGRVLGVTVFVCLSVTVVSLMVNSLAAYAFARMSFRGRSLFFGLIVATMILPIEILIVPLYRVVKDAGLMNTLASLIVPFAASGFGIFFMRQFFAGVPRELDEAAVIDGCGRTRYFFRILVPLARTPLVTLGLIVFLQQWDSFLVPVTFISRTENMVLQVAINNLYAHIYVNDVALLAAGMVIGAVPVIAVFLFTQRYYIAGITTTGIKG